MYQTQDSERPVFATLRYEVRQKLKLSWSEYVLLDMVYHLSAKEGYCYKSWSSIARDLGVTFTGAKKMIARLEERELLIISNGNQLICANSYINCANIEKTGKTPKVNLVPREKPKKLSETELSSKSELSSNKLNLVQQTELSSDKNYSIDIHRDSITNVIEPEPASYGKPEINELFSEWEKVMGYPITSQIAMNRKSANNLLRNKRIGRDAAIRAITWASMAHGDRFAPKEAKAADLIELHRNFNQIYAWARGKATNHERTETPVF